MQKMLGLLGGMSWESTLPYYRIINQYVKETLGGLHSARLLLHSVDFYDIEKMQSSGDWEAAADYLSQAAIGLKQAGADAIVICTNTMHKVADQVEQRCQLPIIHIADAAAAEIQRQQLATVALLGTRYTMEQSFYRGRLTERFGIQVLIPDPLQRDEINRIIFDELCLGQIRDESRQVLCRIIAELQQNGAQGVILGCTELPLLIRPDDVMIPQLDTTQLHALAAARFALGQ
ncbi:aspartate racemase [Dickeya fangzhongdai]|uniref:aspartate/glutamate racemase family protein n=1 Tax=Dickeya fangzhongdai TaxID=1778540 RepID=UPI000573272E|nr:aspartate/glutamate racemase family protein [Dickeya fangzhongdai]KHN53400.1 aspartate racemase [Dickeya fangzhongdai]